MNFVDPFGTTTLIVMGMIVTSLSGLMILMSGLTIGKNHNDKNWFLIGLGTFLAMTTLGLTFWAVNVRHAAEEKNLSTISENFEGNVQQLGTYSYAIDHEDDEYKCRVKRESATKNGEYQGNLSCRNTTDDKDDAQPPRK